MNIDHTWTTSLDGFHSLETLALTSDDELVAAGGYVTRNSDLNHYVAAANNRSKLFDSLPKAKAWAEARNEERVASPAAMRF